MAFSLSVIIPTYNESDWLSDTLLILEKAIAKVGTKLRCEIVVVDDGSTDGTRAVIKEVKVAIKTPIVYIRQENRGRFIARNSGIKNAKFDYILFIDSRVHIGEKALQYVYDKINQGSLEVWNAHVNVYKKGNIYARFWDTITFLAWRRYFYNPRDVSYGIEDFDYYPKGTTCFIAPKKLIEEAVAGFDSKSKDSSRSNDDTLLIKYIASRTRINISPNFNCTYFGRSTLKKFLLHAFHRGQVFVDGFLRNDGNRYLYPIICFLILSLTIPILLIIFPSIILYVVFGFLILWLLELLATAILRVPFVDGLAFSLLTPLFTLYYGAGIWVATLRRLG